MLSCIPIPAFQDNYIWLLFDDETYHGVVVDPGDANPVIKMIDLMDIKLCGILVTHHHHDHTGGVSILKQMYKVPVYGPTNSPFNNIDQQLTENDHLTLSELNTSFTILNIPGHTLDHIAYYDTQHLFCGDTLFLAGCGRLFEGTAEQMLNSLEKLMQLNGKIGVYCAHEYTLQNLMFAKMLEPDNMDIIKRIEHMTLLRKNGQQTIPARLSDEKLTNPFLRVHDPKFKHACETQFQHSFADNIELFKAIRAAKDTFQFSEAKFLKQGKG